METDVVERNDGLNFDADVVADIQRMLQQREVADIANEAAVRAQQPAFVDIAAHAAPRAQQPVAAN